MNKQKLLFIVVGILFLFVLGYMIISSRDRSSNSNVDVELGNDLPPLPSVQNPSNNNPSNNIKEFNEAVSLNKNETITFPDGLTVTLKEINDSRCPKDVQCIWQGEISGTFKVSGGKVSGEKELFIGTERNKTTVLDDYTLTLVGAAPHVMDIKVSYQKTALGGPCYVGGCSAQICSDQPDIISTCEYSEKYACYKTAKCERQTSGKCAWTETPLLTACLLK